MVAGVHGVREIMSSCSCGPSTPLAEFLNSTSPQALLAAKLKPKDPLDPKNLLTPPDQSDPSKASHTPALKAPGTGLRVDITA